MVSTTLFIIQSYFIFSFVQDQLWRIAQRTAVLPLGRGAFTLSTIHTLLTEAHFYLTKAILGFNICNDSFKIHILSEILQAFTVPKLVLAGRLPAQQNAVVSKIVGLSTITVLRTETYYML